jgi:hypothetical protein
MDQQANILGRLAAAREAVEQVCAWLEAPSPNNLDRSAAALAAAAATLSGQDSWLPAARGNPQAIAEAWGLRRGVSLARKLLDSANRYHSGWRRIRAVMTDGYQPGGASTPAPPAGTISLQG